MTVVAACRLGRNAVVLTDSRATWQSDWTIQDDLQKLLPLGPRLGLAYAGDVHAAGAIAQALRERCQASARHRVAPYLAAYVPRVARYLYGRHKSVALSSLDLLLFAAPEVGDARLWHYSLGRSFSRREVGDYVVFGSGQAARSFFEDHYQQLLVANRLSLKDKVDRILYGFSARLRTQAGPHVGGLLQVAILGASGIRPLRYGFMNINPDAPARGKEIQLVQGTWVQRNLSSGEQVGLAKPGQLKRRPGFTFHDYEGTDTEAAVPQLTMFVLCGQVEADSATTTVHLMGRTYAVNEYPLPLKQMVLVELWGGKPEERISAHLVSEARDQVIGDYAYVLSSHPVPEQLLLALEVDVADAGIYFLELRAGGKVLGRKPLALGQLPPDPMSQLELVDAEMSRLSSSLDSTADPQLSSATEAGLEFFCIGQKIVGEARTLRVEGAMVSVFWASYPLVLPVTVGLQARLPSGRSHTIELEATSVRTRETTAFMRGEVPSTSDMTPVQIIRETRLELREPGLYFLTAKVNGKRLATRLLAAEGPEARWSYSLMADDVASVRDGQLLLIAQNRLVQPRVLSRSGTTAGTD